MLGDTLTQAALRANFDYGKGLRQRSSPHPCQGMYQCTHLWGPEQLSCTHLRQGHAIDDQVWLLRALAIERVVIDVVGAGIAGILILHIQERALRATAAQGQRLLVVVEIVEGRGQGGATDNVHLVCLLHIPRYQADVILTDFFLLAGFPLMPIGVLSDSM